MVAAPRSTQLKYYHHELQQQHQTPQSAMVASASLDGRVFERFHRFQQLPMAMQAQVDELKNFLVSSDVFTPHYVDWSSRNVVSVKGDVLMRKIFQKLSNRTHGTTHERAEQFCDALVLGGFISPLREYDPSFATKLEGFADNKALFVLTESKTKTSPSVWDVREGAVQAGAVRLAAQSYSAKAKKRLGWSSLVSYAVVNARLKCLLLFDSDHAHQCSRTMDLSETTVRMMEDGEHSFGLRISSAGQSVTIFLPSEKQQSKWSDALVSAGAHREKDQPEDAVTCGGCLPMLFS